jgi:hypothetical protein
MKKIDKLHKIAFFTLLVSICLACSQSGKEGVNFQQQAIEIADYGLFDLGVADVNGDGRLDIFTANHSAEQSLLLNDGSGGYSDVYADWKIDQDRRFPGLAIFPQEPSAETPGLFINWVGPDVVVRAHRLDLQTPLSGRIEVFTSVKILEKQNVKVRVTETSSSPWIAHSVIAFTGKGDGYFRFRPYNHALPFAFHFDEAMDPALIRVGNRRVVPAKRDFDFMLRDRHGMAWADFNDDGHMDVFITRGGENGLMGFLPMPFWDELFMGASDGMKDVGVGAGLSKEGCPGRQVGLVDYNSDNLLDIFVVCGRGMNSYPNMLFQQTESGRFVNTAAESGLDTGSVGSFVWLDVEHDGDMDLFWADIDGHFLYRNENGTFLPMPLESFNRTSLHRKLSVADFDNNGLLDVFSASSRGNVLFVNDDHSLTAILPSSVGLPDRSLTANWVDHDSNGRMDLHVVPQGLYVQQPDGMFAASQQLTVSEKVTSPYYPVGALATWFDADNNGTRDLLLATQWRAKRSKLSNLIVKTFNLDSRFGGLDYFWKATFLANQNTANHWLQVQLTGPPGNRPAVGARVVLQTSAGQQLQQVGQAEGSYLSTGHYRLYFGLGPKPQSVSLKVVWPDGRLTDISNPPLNQLLKVDWADVS